MSERNSRGYSPILVTAGLSVALLVAATGMQLGKAFAKPASIDVSQLQPAAARAYLPIEDEDGNGTPDWQDELARAGFATSSATTSSATTTLGDPVEALGGALLSALVDGYLSLKEYGAYTPKRGEQLADTLAENFRAPETFVPHTESDLLLDDTVSKERSIQYRADMRVALEPLISDELYELTLYGSYVESKDPAWLERLAQSAERYRAAEKNVLALRIPRDAAQEHLNLANALGGFAEALERMALFSHDPFASLALLRTYNEAERGIDLAFDALVKYYARTILGQ